MDTVKIGWGRREFSIDAPVNINGQMFMRVSEGILDPLYATAMAIDGGAGQDAFVFCSVDITVFPQEFYTEILEAVGRKRPEIPKNGVMLGATHTHTGMDIVNPKSETVDGVRVLTGEEIRPQVVEKICDAICEAWDSRAPGGIAYGYGYAVVGHSRRPVYCKDMNEKYGNIMAPHGKCVMYGKTSEPEFRHYETNADHSVNLMFTYDAEKKLTGIVVNIPCPSQTSEMMTKLSADYWAQIREEVAKTFGADVYVLPQCAPAGDISPRPLHYLPAESRRFRLKYGVGDADGKIAYTLTLDENTKVYDVSDLAEANESLGSVTTLRELDRILAIFDYDGSVGWVFVTERESSAGKETRYCEHCKQEVTWYAWADSHVGKAKLTVNRSTIKDGTATRGGNLCLGAGADVTLNGATVTGGSAAIGGNIALLGADASLKIAENAKVSGGIISSTDQNMTRGNEVYVLNAATNATVTVTGGEIDGDGDERTAVTMFAGSFTMNGGTVKGDVHIANGVGVKLSGAAKISANSKNNKALLLNGNAVAVPEALSNEASIAVTVTAAGKTVAKNAVEADAGRFHSTDEAYTLIFDSTDSTIKSATRSAQAG